MKSEYLNVRLDPELKQAAEKAAEREKRTLSDWVRLLILRAVGRAR